MRFGSLSLPRLDIHADSLQALAYFFMLRLRFSYQNNVRAASFVGIDRPPAGASGGNCIPLKKVLDVVVATIAIALSAPLMLAWRYQSNSNALVRLSFVGKRSALTDRSSRYWKFRSMYAKHPDPAAARQTSKDDPWVTRGGRGIRRSSIEWKKASGYRSEPRTRSSQVRVNVIHHF
jgi:hypothetical protein